MTEAFDLHLVRHGQTLQNLERVALGQLDVARLTPAGAGQAAAAARLLAGSGARSVYSSDLRRAVGTAGPIAAALGVPVIVEAALRERALGAFDGRPSAEILTAPGTALADPRYRPPGGESVAEVHERVAGFLAGLAADADGSPVVLVTHGDTARIALGVIGGHGPDAVPWRDLAPGEVVTVRYAAAIGCQVEPATSGSERPLGLCLPRRLCLPGRNACRGRGLAFRAAGSRSAVESGSSRPESGIR